MAAARLCRAVIVMSLVSVVMASLRGSVSEENVTLNNTLQLERPDSGGISHRKQPESSDESQAERPASGGISHPRKPDSSVEFQADRPGSGGFTHPKEPESGAEFQEDSPGPAVERQGPESVVAFQKAGHSGGSGIGHPHSGGGGISHPR
eukprot:TRINITY_DN930_c0_g1_i1.p1 TRINITY_DN930_c0_g1~~TRINITY_DN930_c0_g1_i1.p1  ORF type:complete len:173 (+),score=24.48 TRINITY_DN930_c0_g1_i1:70-519(+)